MGKSCTDAIMKTRLGNEAFLLTDGATLDHEGYTSKGATASIGTRAPGIFSAGCSEFAGSLFR